MTVLQGIYEDAIHFCEKKTSGAYFEFMFSYTGPGELFREIDRFLWESKHTTHYQNEYTGSVIIELTPWNEKSDYEFGEYFDAFMYFLKSKREKLDIMFFVSGKCSKTLYDRLGRFFDIKLEEPGKGEVDLTDDKITIGFRGRNE